MKKKRNNYFKKTFEQHVLQEDLSRGQMEISDTRISARSAPDDEDHDFNLLIIRQVESEFSQSTNK